MPTAVLVHGAGGGGWEWRLWAEVFAAEGWQVLSPDLMPVEDGLVVTSLDDYLAQVMGWRAQAAVPHVLIGASLGGLLALLSGGMQVPSALVLVNPLPPEGSTVLPGLSERPAIVPWSQAPFEKTRLALPDAGLAAARWVHGRWRDESGRVLNQARAGREFSVPRCPILVLASAEDGDVPPEVSRDLAERLAADFVRVADCSHLGILLGNSVAAAAEQVRLWCQRAIQAPQTVGNAT